MSKKAKFCKRKNKDGSLCGNETIPYRAICRHHYNEDSVIKNSGGVLPTKETRIDIYDQLMGQRA